MTYTITQLFADNERELRRWLISKDPDFALHRQLKDYFLAPTSNFGTAAVRNQNGSIRTLCFFSRYNGKSYIHQYVGEVADLELLREWLGFPCQAFLRPEHTPIAPGWKKVLDVTPGFVVDHPAYDGVFSRVAPRFSGAVYEHD
jgi:hypothetical protein